MELTWYSLPMPPVRITLMSAAGRERIQDKIALLRLLLMMVVMMRILATIQIHWWLCMVVGSGENFGDRCSPFYRRPVSRKAPQALSQAAA